MVAGGVSKYWLVLINHRIIENVHVAASDSSKFAPNTLVSPKKPFITH